MNRMSAPRRIVLHLRNRRGGGGEAFCCRSRIHKALLFAAILASAAVAAPSAAVVPGAFVFSDHGASPHSDTAAARALRPSEPVARSPVVPHLPVRGSGLGTGKAGDDRLSPLGAGCVGTGCT